MTATATTAAALLLMCWLLGPLSATAQTFPALTAQIVPIQLTTPSAPTTDRRAG